MTIGQVALAVCLLAGATHATAQLYRWTDASGKVHFSDTAPPPEARNVEKKSLASGTSGGSEVFPFVLHQPMKDFPVTLYTAPSCNSCAPARQLLNARGVPFKEVSIRSDEQIGELNRATGTNAVPALLVGSTVINGFEETSYHKALDIAGYPKPGVVPARNQREPQPEVKAAEAKPAEAKPATVQPPSRGRYYSGD